MVVYSALILLCLSLESTAATADASKRTLPDYEQLTPGAKQAHCTNMPSTTLHAPRNAHPCNLL